MSPTDKAFDETQLTAFFAEALRKLPKAKIVHLIPLLEKFGEAETILDKARCAQTVVELLFPEAVASIPVGPHSAKELEDSKQRLKVWRENLGARIMQLRTERRMTQAELAEKAGMRQAHISRLEAGLHMPTGITINKIASALGVDPEDIDPGRFDGRCR